MLLLNNFKGKYNVSSIGKNDYLFLSNSNQYNNYIYQLKLLQNLKMLQENQQQQIRQYKKLVEALAIIDLDPNLSSFRQTQQKWISSVEFVIQPSKQQKTNCKILPIVTGLYLSIGFCEKNCQPIYEIDFIQNPGPQWITVRLPHQFSSQFNFTLCYKTQQTQFQGPLADIDIICPQRKSRFGEQKIQVTLPHGYQTLNHPMSNTFIIYRKMKSRLQQNFKATLIQKYPLVNQRINVSSLPLFCFPEGIRLSRQIKGFITFNFILTRQNAERIYCTCLIFKQNLSQHHRAKLKVKNLDKIYNQKAICILSRYCYTDQFSECLQHLYRLSLSKNDLPFYKVAQNFVDKLALPNQIGKMGCSYSYGGSNIMFETSLTYPVVSEKAIYCIFKFLHIETIISVFQAILLERSILFVSQSKTVLGYAIQAFTAFIFPFKWQQVMIPVLTYSLIDYISAPVPLIAGISPYLLQTVTQTQQDMVIVYLDKNKIINDETLPPLPDKMEKTLTKKLNQFNVYEEDQVKQYLQNPQNTYIFKMQEIQNPHFNGYKIRDIFFQFNLTLMRNFKKFWKKDMQKYSQMRQTSSFGLSTQPQLLNDIFRTQDFLYDLGMTKVGSFGYKFTQSSIFTAFIEQKNANPKDPQIGFFQQCIIIKKNKKQIPFITSITNERFTVAQHPQIENNGKNNYVYEKFPSILCTDIKQDEIKLQIKQNENEERQQFLQQMVCQEYEANSCLFQAYREKMDDPIYDKMLGLLLRKYQDQFPIKQQTKMQVLIWFFKVYTKQIDEINDVFNYWPQHTHSISFSSINKKQYMLQVTQIPKKKDISSIVGVHENENYEFLIHGEKKIIIVPSKATKTQGRNSKKVTFQIGVPSFRIKSLLNKIIPLQSLWLFGFVEQVNSYSQWTIQTLIDFRQWMFQKKKQQ